MPDHGASLLRLTYANAHERLAEDGRRAVAMASSGRGADAANIVAQALTVVPLSLIESAAVCE